MKTRRWEPLLFCGLGHFLEDCSTTATFSVKITKLPKLNYKEYQTKLTSRECGKNFHYQRLPIESGLKLNQNKDVCQFDGADP